MKDVLPTVDNPRTIDKKDPRIAELAASIKANGLLEPVLVRKHPKKRGKYELRAGERRLTAHKVAGLQTIDAIVEEDMDDTRAGLVTVLENLQREDLSAVEVAQGLKTLMVKAKMTPKEIAAATGKHFSWVYRRISLTQLSDKWLKKVADPKSEFSHMGAKHLELVARFPEMVQDELLEKIGNYAYENLTVDRMRDMTNRLTHTLSGMPWASGAGLVANVGGCLDCPKRSSQKLELFEDVKEDRCLDPDCYERKETAFVRLRMQALRKEHGAKLLLMGHGGWSENEKKMRLGSNAKVEAAWVWKAAKKDSPGAKPCLIVLGDGAGTLKWMKADRQGCASAPRKKTAKEIQEQQEREARELVAGDLKRRLMRSELKDIDLSPGELAAMAVMFGTDQEWPDGRFHWQMDREEKWERAALLARTGMDSLWAAVAQNLVPEGYVLRHNQELFIKQSQRAGDLVGFDVAAALRLAEKRVQLIPAYKKVEKQWKALLKQMQDRPLKAGEPGQNIREIVTIEAQTVIEQAEARNLADPEFWLSVKSVKLLEAARAGTGGEQLYQALVRLDGTEEFKRLKRVAGDQAKGGE